MQERVVKLKLHYQGVMPRGAGQEEAAFTEQTPRKSSDLVQPRRVQYTASSTQTQGNCINGGGLCLFHRTVSEKVVQGLDVCVWDMCEENITGPSLWHFLG